MSFWLTSLDFSLWIDLSCPENVNFKRDCFSFDEVPEKPQQEIYKKAPNKLPPIASSHWGLFQAGISGMQLQLLQYALTVIYILLKFKAVLSVLSVQVKKFETRSSTPLNMCFSAPREPVFLSNCVLSILDTKYEVVLPPSGG